MKVESPVCALDACKAGLFKIINWSSSVRVPLPEVVKCTFLSKCIAFAFLSLIELHPGRMCLYYKQQG